LCVFYGDIALKITTLKGYIELLNLIKKLRLQQQISQSFIAYKLGSNDEDFYGKIERNEKAMRLFHFIIISRVLGFSPSVLCKKAGIEAVTPPPHASKEQINKLHKENISCMDICQEESICPHLKASICVNCIIVNEADFNKSIYNAFRDLLKSKKIYISVFSEIMGNSANAYFKREREIRFFTFSTFFHCIRILKSDSQTLMNESGNYFWISCKHISNGIIIE